jgi:nicotinate-nucleotide adenylyltransferase
MAPRQRIGLFGGTFDPVHAGHLSVARKLTELLSFDSLLFIPAHIAPHKRSAAVTPALHRYAMLALATADDDRLKVSTAELDAPERPYTVETLCRLHSSMGEDADLFFVMGGDSWNEINTWKDWERLLTMTNHVVVTRPGFDLKTDHVPAEIRKSIVDLRGGTRERVLDVESSWGGTKIYLTDVVQMDISATEIREAVRAGRREETLALLPRSVADYIRKYRLYTNEYRKQFSDQGTGASS